MTDPVREALHHPTTETAMTDPVREALAKLLPAEKLLRDFFQDDVGYYRSRELMAEVHKCIKDTLAALSTPQAGDPSPAVGEPLYLVMAGGDVFHSEIVPESKLDDAYLLTQWGSLKYIDADQRSDALAHFHDDDSWTHEEATGHGERVKFHVSFEDGWVEVVRLPAEHGASYTRYNNWPQANLWKIPASEWATISPQPAAAKEAEVPDDEILQRLMLELLGRDDRLHPETVRLVVSFSRALAKKLADAEKKYGYSDGWMRGDWMDQCRAKLHDHVAKGDPRDVAAYCAFLWHHSESTAPTPPPAPQVGPSELKDAELLAAQRFAGAVMEMHRNHGYPGDVDGGDLQALAEKHGMIEAFEATEPCCESCACAEYGGLGEFPMMCYRNTPACQDAIRAAQPK